MARCQRDKTMRVLTLLASVTALLLLSGCDQTPDPKSLTRSLKTGNDLYAYYCKDCHRNRGLGPHLENLPVTERSLKDYEIMLIIKFGYSDRHSMPSFDLSDENAEAIAEYLVQVRSSQQK